MNVNGYFENETLSHNDKFGELGLRTLLFAMKEMPFDSDISNM